MAWGCSAAREQIFLLHQVMTSLPYPFSHETATASEGPQCVCGEGRKDQEFPAAGSTSTA